MHWLVARKKVRVDVCDMESKWTALHRSAYYGQLGAAALLLKVGGAWWVCVIDVASLSVYKLFLFCLLFTWKFD